MVHNKIQYHQRLTHFISITKSMLYILLSFNIILMATGQMLFKKSSLVMLEHADLPLIMRYITNYWLYLGVIAFGVATLLWVKILSMAKISYVYPLQSINYIIVSLLAYYIFGEKLSSITFIGIIFILIGISLIAQTK